MGFSVPWADLPPAFNHAHGGELGDITLLAKGTFLLLSDDSGVSGANRWPQQNPHHLHSTVSRPVTMMLCVREGSTVFRRRSICFLLQYSTAVPKKRVNSPSTISRTKASHLCIIFFSSITIILTDSRGDDKSISSLTAMI